MELMLNFDEVEERASKLKGLDSNSQLSPKIVFPYVYVLPYCMGVESKAYKDDNGEVIIKHTKSMISGKGFVESVSSSDCLVNFGITSVWVAAECLALNDKREFELNRYTEEY